MMVGIRGITKPDRNASLKAANLAQATRADMIAVIASSLLDLHLFLSSFYQKQILPRTLLMLNPDDETRRSSSSSSSSVLHPRAHNGKRGRIVSLQHFLVAFLLLPCSVSVQLSSDPCSKGVGVCVRVRGKCFQGSSSLQGSGFASAINCATTAPLLRSNPKSLVKMLSICFAKKALADSQLAETRTREENSEICRQPGFLVIS